MWEITTSHGNIQHVFLIILINKILQQKIITKFIDLEEIIIVKYFVTLIESWLPFCSIMAKNFGTPTLTDNDCTNYLLINICFYVLGAYTSKSI